MAPRKLNTKIEDLFKSDTFEIGGDKIVIRPFSLEQWIKVIQRINESLDKFTSADINFENYKEYSKLLKLVTIIVSDFPDLLEDATGIVREDLVALPTEILIGLLTKVIEVQMASKDVFLKNWNCLTAILPVGTQEKIEEVQKTVASK